MIPLIHVLIMIVTQLFQRKVEDYKARHDSRDHVFMNIESTFAPDLFSQILFRDINTTRFQIKFSTKYGFNLAAFTKSTLLPWETEQLRNKH